MSNAWQLGGSTHLKKDLHASNAVFLFHEFVFKKRYSITASNAWFIGCTFIEDKNNQKKIVTDPFSSHSNTIVISKEVVYAFLLVGYACSLYLSYTKIVHLSYKNVS